MHTSTSGKTKWKIGAKYLSAALLFLLLPLWLTSCGMEPGEISFSNTDVLDSFLRPEFRREMRERYADFPRYRLQVDVDRENSLAEGRASIGLTNRQQVNYPDIRFRLYLNAADRLFMTINEVRRDGTAIPFHLEQEGTVLVAEIASALTPGESMNLDISYTIGIPEDGDVFGGFVRIDKEGFSLPYFYPSLARFVDGAWEQNALTPGAYMLSADPSWFIMELTGDQDTGLIATGVSLAETGGDKRQTRYFAAGPVRQVYIGAIRSAATRRAGFGGTSVLAHGHNWNGLYMHYAADYASDALKFLSSEFGEYPFRNFQVVPQPMRDTGSAYPGLIPIRNSYYSILHRSSMEPVELREAAFQWFYNLMGVNPQTDAWIDEGLASYSSWLYMKDRYGDREADIFKYGFQSRIMRLRLQPGEVPPGIDFVSGRIPGYGPEKQPDAYVALVQGRAPLFFLELRELIGEDRLNDMLKELVNYSLESGKNVDTAMMIHSIRRAAGGIDVEPLLSAYSDYPRYRLRLNVDLLSSSARGDALITVVNRHSTAYEDIRFRLYMNARPFDGGGEVMTIDAVRDGEGGDLTFRLEQGGSVLVVETGLSPGDSRTVEISCRFSIPSDVDYYYGFARIDTEGFSLPYWYPVLARFVDGGWEQTELGVEGDFLSADPAWFIIELTGDESLTLVTSGIELSSRKSGGMRTLYAAAGPVRDVYVAARRDPESGTADFGDTRIFSSGPASRSVYIAQAAEISAEALKLFSAEFGDYPFVLLRVTAQPMNALGVEFPGLIAILDSLYASNRRNYFEPTIVHEVAHQWFFGMMGTNQQIDPWIDEGLAQYATWLYYLKTYGPGGADGFASSFEDRMRRMELPREAAVPPIDLPVADYAKFGDRAYSALIYGRAPQFFIELRDLIGEETLHELLRNLVAASLSSGEPVDSTLMIAAIRRAAPGSDIEKLLSMYFSGKTLSISGNT